MLLDLRVGKPPSGGRCTVPGRYWSIIHTAAVIVQRRVTDDDVTPCSEVLAKP